MKPVAYGKFLPEHNMWVSITGVNPNPKEGYVPLYPLKELTENEIFQTAIENGAYQSKKSGNIYPDDMNILNFARAILKKAGEK